MIMVELMTIINLRNAIVERLAAETTLTEATIYQDVATKGARLPYATLTFLELPEDIAFGGVVRNNAVITITNFDAISRRPACVMLGQSIRTAFNWYSGVIPIDDGEVNIIKSVANNSPMESDIANDTTLFSTSFEITYK